MDDRCYDLHSSPFLELRHPWTWQDTIRMLILLPLALVRSLIGVSALCIVAVVNSIAAYGQPIHVPLSPWRRQAVLASKELVVVVLWMLGFFRIKVHGRENILQAQKEKAVVVFNHISWLDAFFLVWMMAPSGVAKAFNARLPVIKHAVRAMQTVYIPDAPRRQRPQILHGATATTANLASTAADIAGKAQAAAASAVAGAAGSIAGGTAGTAASPGITEVLLQRVNDPRYCQPGGFPLVVMAPEAMVSSGQSLLKFRTGAFALRRPVLPVLFRYDSRRFNPAWTLHNDLWHYLRMITQWSNSVEITILPPYQPTAVELDDPRRFANNVRALMAGQLGIPLSSQSAEHYAALCKLCVGVALDGKSIYAKPGVLAADGRTVDLTPVLKNS